MEEQIFCDGIGRIAVIGGVVRLDLFTYSPTETDANGNPRPILSHRIVMGTDGFLRSSEKVVEAVGMIGRARAQAPAPQAQPQPPQAQPAQGQPPAPQGQPHWPPHATQAAPPPVPPPPPQADAPQAARAPAPPPSRPPFP